MNTPERRKDTRYKMIYPVGHAKFAFGRDVQIKIDAASKTKDLSSSGALFVSPVPYQLNDIVRLEIPVTGWGKYKTAFLKPGDKTHEPVIVLGKVMHSTQTAEGHQVGVHFVGIDADHQQALNKYLRNRNKGEM